jgi:multicomponent Na+:H+ antiporter subunit G
MTTLAVVEEVLVVLGVAAMLVCCLGVAVMPGVFARIHYQSAAGTVATTPIVLAVIVHAGLSSVSVKAALILALSWISGPILSHAIARAARLSRGEPEGST